MSSSTSLTPLAWLPNQVPYFSVRTWQGQGEGFGLDPQFPSWLGDCPFCHGCLPSEGSLSNLVDTLNFSSHRNPCHHLAPKYLSLKPLTAPACKGVSFSCSVALSVYALPLTFIMHWLSVVFFLENCPCLYANYCGYLNSFCLYLFRKVSRGR